MALVNDSVAVTPGSGATIASHSPGGSNTTEYQVMMAAGPTGHLLGTRPHYGLAIPPLDCGVAHNYLWEFFNAPSSGLTVSIEGIYSVPCTRQARSVVLGTQVDFFRTTAVSSGGSFGAFEASNSTMTANFFRFDTNDASLSSHISCKTEMTSITTGTRLFDFTSNTSSLVQPAYLLQGINLVPGGYQQDSQALTVRPGTGIACRQGPIASLGSLGWLVTFKTDP